MKTSWDACFNIIGCFLCGIFIGCIIWGSTAASQYAKYKNTRKDYAATTCLILNYTVTKHTCQDCTSNYCTDYTCFDERFSLKYPIPDGTNVTSIFSSSDRGNPYQQTQIGSSFTCYYRPSDVTLIILDLPNLKSTLIQLCVAFGLTGICILVVIISIIVHLT
ncbi:unnamed protein product [Adineta steineri]|uniref:Uncharacterized protein n=1 Tax=Adineta steineri TaxID=433720 RepID=A0A814WW69_9BILA|nr:unnamed protein product [Adineta steineri]CAF1211106.1 unnamed protein product [Adineta steineri]CAF1535177.1 unnamed protein product [Adineta steineri]